MWFVVSRGTRAQTWRHPQTRSRYGFSRDKTLSLWFSFSHSCFYTRTKRGKGKKRGILRKNKLGRTNKKQEINVHMHQSPCQSSNTSENILPGLSSTGSDVNNRPSSVCLQRFQCVCEFVSGCKYTNWADQCACKAKGPIAVTKWHRVHVLCGVNIPRNKGGLAFRGLFFNALIFGISASVTIYLRYMRGEVSFVALKGDKKLYLEILRFRWISTKEIERERSSLTSSTN